MSDLGFADLDIDYFYHISILYAQFEISLIELSRTNKAITGPDPRLNGREYAI